MHGANKMINCQKEVGEVKKEVCNSSMKYTVTHVIIWWK